MLSINDGVLIENALSELGVYSGKTLGFSMNPFIVSGRDVVLVRKKSKRLKKHDVALYKRIEDGAYILHRVKRVKSNGYDIVGDNHIKLEKDIQESQVVGVLDGYYRRKKFISCNSFWYKLKTRIWCFLPIKLVGVFVLRVFSIISRLFKKKEKTV